MKQWQFVPDGCDEAFTKVDISAKSERLPLGSTAEQPASVTDNEIHVSFSLFSWSICAENTPLCSLRELDTKVDKDLCQNLSKIKHLLHYFLSWNMLIIMTSP